MKYFLSIYIILLFGSASLYAKIFEDNIEISLNSVKNQSELNDAQLNLILKSFHATIEKEVKKIRATDNEVVEEEESISTKRELLTSTYFSTVLYAEQLGCFCSNIKKRLPQNDFFVPFISNRLHIIFGVFLI